MSIQPQPLFEPVQLAAGPHTYYTAGFKTRIDKLTVANPTGVARQVTAYWVPSDATVGDARTIIIPTFTLDAGDAVDLWQFMGHVVNIGDMVGASCDVPDAVNFFGSGTTVS